jgi:hypothetical protein
MRGALGAGAMRLLPLVLLLPACINVEVDSDFESESSTSGASIEQDYRLTGCNGQASSAIPDDGEYVITTFGGPGDHQPMSCGGRADSSWYYAASRQRYGCGSRIAIRANGKCVVAQTDDYGPDVCVENAAGMPIIDVSPKVARDLFGVSGAGWSDHLVVTVEEVAAGTPLGACATTPTDPTDPTDPDPGADTSVCPSATLGRDVAAGTCVRAAGDGNWYQCVEGVWQSRASSSGCEVAYGYCNSATLGQEVPARTCVQSAGNRQWYQCNGSIWAQPVNATAQTGPLGACSASHPL